MSASLESAALAEAETKRFFLRLKLFVTAHPLRAVANALWWVGRRNVSHSRSINLGKEEVEKGRLCMAMTRQKRDWSQLRQVAVNFWRRMQTIPSRFLGEIERVGG